MKPVYTEEYYFKHWDSFLVPVPGEDFIDLEKQLTIEMRVYSTLEILSDQLLKIQRVEADKLVAKCESLVRDEMRRIKSIESGESSMGYTTQAQEIHARADLRKRFEFNCLQLREFKKKYL